MADGLTLDLNTTAVIAALEAFGVKADAFVEKAAELTAKAIVREANSRLKRQLGHTSIATPKRPDLGRGLTLAGITYKPTREGGFLVKSTRQPYPDLPRWLEKGTRKGKGTHANVARPYFYSSALLEEGEHYRRIEQALSDAIKATGLGE